MHTGKHKVKNVLTTKRLPGVFGFLDPFVHFYANATTPEACFLSPTETHKTKYDVVTKDNLFNEHEVVMGLNISRQSQLRVIN